MEDSIHGPGMSHPEMHLRTRRGGGRLRPIHFKEESIPSLRSMSSFAALRMTLLNRLRLTRRTSYLKCIVPCVAPVPFPTGLTMPSLPCHAQPDCVGYQVDQRESEPRHLAAK